MKYEIMKRKLTEEEQKGYDETVEIGEWRY